MGIRNGTVKRDYVYFYIVWLPGYPKTGGGPGLVCGPPFVDSWLVLPITVGPHLKPRSNRAQNPSFPSEVVFRRSGVRGVLFHCYNGCSVLK